MALPSHILENILTRVKSDNIYDLDIDKNDFVYSFTFINKFMIPNHVINRIANMNPYYNIRSRKDAIIFSSGMNPFLYNPFISYENNILMMSFFQNIQLYFDGNFIYYVDTSTGKAVDRGIKNLYLTSDAKQKLVKFLNELFYCSVCNKYLCFKIINNKLEIEDNFQGYNRCSNDYYDKHNGYSSHGDVRIVHTNCKSKSSCYKCETIVCKSCLKKINCSKCNKDIIYCGSNNCSFTSVVKCSDCEKSTTSPRE